MNPIKVQTLSRNKFNELSYLLINEVAGSIAIVDPNSTNYSILNQDSQLKNYSVDWVLLTHPPKDNAVLPVLHSEYGCVIASSFDVIQQLPESFSPMCEVLEDHEVIMLGHLELEAIFSRGGVNYQAAEHIFLYNEKSIESAELEKLSNKILIHIVQFNKEKSKYNRGISPLELKCLIN